MNPEDLTSKGYVDGADAAIMDSLTALDSTMTANALWQDNGGYISPANYNDVMSFAGVLQTICKITHAVFLRLRGVQYLFRPHRVSPCTPHFSCSDMPRPVHFCPSGHLAWAVFNAGSEEPMGWVHFCVAVKKHSGGENGAPFKQA